MSAFTPLSLLAAALLAGCAHKLSTPQAPVAPPTPSVWQAPLPASATVAHAGSTAQLDRWWAGFGDPLLVDLQAAAQRASPGLASAVARIARARAAQTAADATGLPRLDALGALAVARPGVGAPTQTSASLGLQAGWELDLSGAVAAGRGAARARLAAAQAGWHDARVALAADVAASYTALRACEAQVEQARLDLASRGETARLTERSAAAGFTAPADAALVRAGLAQVRGQWLATQAQCELLVKVLVEITDLPEPDLRARLEPGRARVAAAPALGLPALPAALLSQRPDLADAANAVDAAAAEMDQSHRRERPQLSLSGAFNLVGVRAGGIRSDGATWSMGPLVVSWPIWDAGARAAGTAAAQAGYDEAVAQYKALARRAVREVESALVSLDATARREVDAQTAARDFESSLRATEARQRGGLASLFDLETARRQLLQARSALIELQRERTTAWINLYRALGGGWNAAPPPVAAHAPSPP